MPSTWQVDVVGVEPQYVRASGIHAFLSNWFCETDPEHRDLKGYSLGPPVPFANGIRLVVSCSDDTLAALLADLPIGQPVRFGTTHPRVGRVSAAPLCQEETSWADLVAIRQVGRWLLEFITPVSLRRGHVSQPWPSPDAVLSGLRNRWQAVGGPPLPWDITDATVKQVAVTGVELRTVRTNQAPQEVSGALGTVEWTWVRGRNEDELGRSAVDSLLRFAAYSGCGAYPQYGLGRTVISPVPGPRSRG